MIGVIRAVIRPIGDVVGPLFHVLTRTPSCSAEWPRTKLIGDHAVVNFVLASFIAVHERVRLVGVMLSHCVVVLVITEFSAIGRVFVESMAGNGRNDLNAGGAGWHSEIQLTIVF